MQKKHHFFFSFGCPNLRGGGWGSTWLGQKTKFFDRFNLKASLILKYNTFIYLFNSDGSYKQRLYFNENCLVMTSEWNHVATRPHGSFTSNTKVTSQLSRFLFSLKNWKNWRKKQLLIKLLVFSYKKRSMAGFTTLVS